MGFIGLSCVKTHWIKSRVSMIIAAQTLQKIEEYLVKDQGAAFRGHLKDLMPQAEDAYSTSQIPFRKHLGASLIGKECSRELWYSWHWCKAPKFSGRILRLFNRGHLEEPRFMALLLMIGCRIYQFDDKGKQFRIAGHGGHYGGGLDGVVVGIPEYPTEPILSEFKTHSEKSFNDVAKQGVQHGKPEHFHQMQQYMGYHKLRAAIYFAVNKNTDEIHAEIVLFDPIYYQQYFDKAGKIIASPVPLPKLSENPKFFKCTFCDFKPICHGKDAPEKNCRTCNYSKASLDNDKGEWLCTNPLTNINVISFEQQLKGCDNYIVNPHIKAAL